MLSHFQFNFNCPVLTLQLTEFRWLIKFVGSSLLCFWQLTALSFAILVAKKEVEIDSKLQCTRSAVKQLYTQLLCETH